MLTDRERLLLRAARPRIVALERALSRLASTLTVMNTGAHPDDEKSGMLAVMRYAMGMRVVVACSTRGEGGQNGLGPERTGALGVLRSREMEEAARILDADIAWLGHGPDDPVHDFGFSKSGPDTLSRWGRERTIERLVRAYRQFRPDIVIPTFLDVPGQHGHHRAMTEAAEVAIALAADPQAFPAHAAEGLAPWNVAKYYLPAWSGGGDTYDDEVPPPPATSHVVAGCADPVTGMTYDRIGEVSRAFHASQNMGHWHPARTQWPLHLVHGQAEDDIRAGLPLRLADLGDSPALGKADAAMAQAVAAFPHAQAVAAALAEARAALVEAGKSLSSAESAAHHHRLTRKQEEIDAALALAAGIEINARVVPSNIATGGKARLIVEIARGIADSVAASAVVGPDLVAGDMVVGDGCMTGDVRAKPDAAIRNAFAPDFHSLGANGALSVKVEATVAGQKIVFHVDTEEAVQIVPPHAVELSPDALVVKIPASGTLRIAVKSDAPLDRVAVEGADGLKARRVAGGIEVEPASGLEPGRYSLAVSVDGAPAYAVTPIAYPHIGRTHFVRPQKLEVLALDLALPSARIGYVGGGSDRVGMWLRRMGADVTELDATALAGDFSRFDTIVVGILAFGTRPDLAASTGHLHDWVKAGGHLVTLYHRPGDGWNPERTPVLPLTIGSPSLRWRVTNPNAQVEVLAPDHPLLIGPNRITAADFEGWDKERGLYFASAWDNAYAPLLGMSDDGEKQLTGSLLSARIGKGRHTHASLVLHHQLDKLVPGAFRLLANLVQPA